MNETIYAGHSARSRLATFVTSSPLQLRPTYATEGSAKRSKSVRLPNTKEHLSRDSHVIRQACKRPNKLGPSLRSEILGTNATRRGKVRSVPASHVASQRARCRWSKPPRCYCSYRVLSAKAIAGSMFIFGTSDGRLSLAGTAAQLCRCSRPRAVRWRGASAPRSARRVASALSEPEGTRSAERQTLCRLAAIVHVN